MRHIAELFVKKGGKFSEAYIEKIKEMQDTDKVGQDFSGIIMGKQVKFCLPDSVKMQYRALLEAENFVNLSLFSTTEEVYNLHMRVWEFVKQHMRVDDKDGCKMDDSDFTVEFMEQAIVLYLSEILFPLYHRSCTQAENRLEQSLTEYMTKLVNE